MRRYSGFFLFLSAVFVTVLVASNILAVKLADVDGYIIPGALALYPLTYLFGDVLTEVYGYAAARRVIWTGFFCNLVFVGAEVLVQNLSPAPFWHGQSAFAQILGYTPRLLVASLVGYTVGDFLNSYVLAKLKLLTNGQLLWTRTIGSTIVGQLADTGLFMVIAFAGTVPTPVLWDLMKTQYVIKVLYETIATPLTYRIVNFLKRAENIDTFDRATNFSPLALTEG